VRRDGAGLYHPDDISQRDPGLVADCLPWLERLDRTYFRLTASGHDNLPQGPALLVANHNGGILGPDLLCTLPVLWRHLGPSFPLFAMAHDFAMVQVRPLGRFLQGWGALRASRRNARRVLEAGGQVLVYPGGDLEAYRHFSHRHRVRILPRSGFVSVAREMGVPIVPIVVRGAHQSAVIFHEGERLARLLGLVRWGRVRRFPLALALPWGLAVGPYLPYLPLPWSLRLSILSPIYAESEASDAEVATNVQARMQTALEGLAE